MGFASIREFFAQVALITPEQFEEWNKAWKVAAENGSQESLLVFICRTGHRRGCFPATTGHGPALAFPGTCQARCAAGSAAKSAYQGRFSIFSAAYQV